MSDRSIVTIAQGKKYLAYAFTLARSYKFHNSTDIPFYIISDEDFQLPSDLSWVKKKIITTEIMGRGLEYRFNFTQVIPTKDALFIDSDSIIYGNIEHAFQLFSQKHLSVVGLKVFEGVWAGLDASTATKKFTIPYLIRYCGAFYYVSKSSVADDICAYARTLVESAAENNFQQHTYSLNDEPILSIAMSKFNIEPIPDTGNLWSDIVQLKSHKDLNVFNKTPTLNNSKTDKYKFWIPEGPYSPLIFHMGGAIYNKNPWIFDALRLKLFYKYGLSENLSDWLVTTIVKPVYFFFKAFYVALRK